MLQAPAPPGRECSISQDDAPQWPTSAVRLEQGKKREEGKAEIMEAQQKIRNTALIFCRISTNQVQDRSGFTLYEPACVQYVLSLGYVVGRVTKEVSSRMQVQDRSLLTRDLTKGIETVVIALVRPPSDECKKVALQTVFRLAGVR